VRRENLTFGNRVHCPFCGRFFFRRMMNSAFETCAEKMAELGERVAAAALDEPALFKRFHCARVKNGCADAYGDMDGEHGFAA